MPNLKRYYGIFFHKSTWNGGQEQNLFSTFINYSKSSCNIQIPQLPEFFLNVRIFSECPNGWAQMKTFLNLYKVLENIGTYKVLKMPKSLERQDFANCPKFSGRN